jgi:serine/threonine protein kinase
MGELTGTTFAGLEVRDAIGRDLVSTVYVAVESDDERVVELRVVAEDLCAGEGGDRELYGRFLRRAAAALTFDHPNAPTVEEVGEHRGRGYLITPHVDTVPFDDYITEHGPLDVEPAMALFTQVADVLDAGHRAGLTHGALNPTTLRIATPLDGPPTVHLTGFGIGALLELRLRRDRKQLLDVDELLYVAPEQLRRQPLTGRTDQYAMACALMHALTGEPPFVRDSVGGLFGAHLFVTPTFADGNDSEAAILKALTKEPRDRYATCTQLLSDVTRAGQSAANRRRSERRRRKMAAHSWLSEGGEATLAAASTSMLDDEPIPTLVGDPGSDPDGNGFTTTGAPGSPDDSAADAGTLPDASTDTDDAGTQVSEDEPVDDGVDGDAATDDDVPGAGGSSSSPTHADPEVSFATAAGSTSRAGSALSNGERSVPARARAGAASVENSWTVGRQAADMAYPAAGDEPEPAPATETAEDLDDVPLLSEVLSRRPYDPEPKARRLPAVLMGLIILAAIATAIALWFIVT